MAQSFSPSGYLFKLSEKQRWQKRWFVLKGNQMEYYKKEEDSGKEHPKGVIELQLSILARTRSECHQDIKWPKSVGEESCFGVATAKRAWYFYADDEETARMWVNTLSSVINQSGQPQDAKDDVKSKPENQKNDDKPKSRMFNIVDRCKDWGILGMRLLAHNGNRTQMLADSGVIENDEANTALGAAGTMIQEQAEIDPTETSAKDRFKDDDAPLEERLAMLGRDAAGAVGSSRLLWDVMGEIATNVGEEITDNAEHVGTAGKS